MAVESFVVPFLPDSLLFVNEGQRVEKACNSFSTRFREYILLAGLVSREQLEAGDMNPARPYALRAAFSLILRLHGMEDALIEFLMAHKDRYGGAYMRMTTEEVCDKYAEFEEFLSVTDITGLADVQRKLDEVLALRDQIIARQAIQLEGVLSQLEAVEEREAMMVQLLLPDGVDSNAARAIFQELGKHPSLVAAVKEKTRDLTEDRL